MKKQVKRYIMQRILTEYVVPALILILVISIFYNIFFSVKFYSYREKCQDSLVMAISREASATKDYLQSILKDKNYSQYNMWRVYSHFNNLSSLCRTNSDIYHFLWRLEPPLLMTAQPLSALCRGFIRMRQLLKTKRNICEGF